MDRVVTLLSTYNGEKYLQQQLNSLYSQENVDVQIIVRDDGSNDRTHEILDCNQTEGKLTWYKGENLKPAKSFMDLVYTSPDAEWYAFCDQDDIWLPDKLKIAIRALKECNSNRPALYYGHPRLVDSELNPLESSINTYDRMLDFYSAMINSNATGCTMVFNKALMDLVRREHPSFIAMHDGWLHKICILSKGNLIYDEDVHILYRQHSANVIGSSNSIKKKFMLKVKSLRSKECIRSRTIASLVENYSDLMSDDELATAKRVAEYKNSLSNRIRLLVDTKIKTNYLRRNVMYKLAVITGAF